MGVVVIVVTCCSLLTPCVITTATRPYQANISAAKGQGTPVQYNLIFQHTGIHRHQIIHAQWGAYDFNPPHFVAVVPHRREVLVAIRGSMNLRDAITDVMAAELPFPGSPNSLTHAGFLLAARVKLSILGFVSPFFCGHHAQN